MQQAAAVGEGGRRRRGGRARGELRGVGADRGGRGGAHSDFQVDDEILTMGLTR